MKFLKKICVAAAAVATAIFVAGSAQAATVPEQGAGVYAGTLINEATNRASVDVNAVTSTDWLFTLGDEEIVRTGTVLELTLSGGARWLQGGARICNNDVVESGSCAALPLAYFAPEEGSENVSEFLVSGDIAAGTSIRLLNMTPTIDASRVPAGGRVTLTANLVTEVLNRNRSIYGTPLPYRLLQLESLYQDATLTPAAVGTFDVTTGYVELTGASTDMSGEATVSLTVNSEAPAPVGETRVLFTLEGDMSAGVVRSISGGDELTSTNAAGAVPSAAAGGSTAPGMFMLDRENGMAYAANAEEIAANTDLNATLQITFNVRDEAMLDDDDMVAIPAGAAKSGPSSYILTVTGQPQGTGNSQVYTGSAILAASPALSFRRNGSSFVSNTLGPLNMVNITDRSGSLTGVSPSGDVSISAYDPAGDQVTCAPLDLRLPNNGTLTISGADIIAACPGAKRIEGFINSTRILSTNIKRTENGATSSSALSATGETAAN